LKKYLKILGALAAVAILWLGYSYVRFVQDPDNLCDTVTINREINPETFVKIRGCLSRSVARKKTFVVENSDGGNGAAALAIGILIHKHNWDVEVVGICPSACANFIFPAGKTKYLHQTAMLLFHGGPYQANLQEMAESFDQSLKKNGAPAESVIIGREGKEGTISYSPTLSKADIELREFFSLSRDPTMVEGLAKMRSASDQFYKELGVNPLLSTYGQVGAYESLYNSGKHYGFIYRLDSLNRLGIRNIVLKDGEWHPERHPAYPQVYEVTFP
jgi:hypothetical protein